MICPNCGREIPDGTVCPCMAGSQKMLSTNPALNVIKTVGSSPLFLVAAILYTLGVILSFVGMLTLRNAALYGMLDQLMYRLPPELSADLSEAVNEGFTGGMISGTAGGLIASCISVAALWLHYFTCRSMRSGNISTSGLTIWKVFTTIALVGVYIGAISSLVGTVLILVFGTGAVSGELPGGDGMLVFVIVFLSFVMAVCVFAICILTAKKRLIDRARGMTTTGVPDIRVSQFLVVIYWISGVLNALTGLGTLAFSLLAGLSTLCVAAYTIMIALCLGRYRQQMAMLMYQPVPVPVYYPAPQGYQPAPQPYQPAQAYIPPTPAEDSVSPVQYDPQPIPVEQPAPMEQPVPVEQPAPMEQPVPVEQPAPVEEPAPEEQPEEPKEDVPGGE